MPRARKAYANRTDLQAPKVTATPIPGQAYGEQAAQTAAERVAPLGATPQPVFPRSPTVPLFSSPVHTAPGSLPFLDATNRPNEPVTAGLPFGPGAGAEVMNQQTSIPRPISAAFDSVAAIPNAPATVSGLADAARLLGL